jgi:hypothetical protein
MPDGWSADSGEVVFGETGHLHEVLQQANLQRRVAVERYPLGAII